VAVVALGTPFLPAHSFHPGTQSEAAAEAEVAAVVAGRAARREPATRQSKSALPGVAASSRKPQARPLL